ncbi:SGNH/GDSL hydrolase family protein [Sphingobium sp. CCH11-B1]|jgi:lysophospholipase L1-like esterase|uniref:SGNH/GDSL hydrolase family protein n=1 Tax=Sphingobium sp. CCH11-B1 TaxID=1768781 RepID=UPI00083251E3|nr:SGNH/GDSL hydrolase family protein [Sphingobium sp. CCH11-B1]MEA3389274.1 SGNH/GDSL hydrolase family protein [Pseudomonadota bacterium]
MIRLLSSLTVAFCLLSVGPAFAQVLSSAPVAYGAGSSDDRIPAAARMLPPLPLPAGAKVMAFCDSHSAFNNVAANSGVLAAPVTAKGLIEAAWSIDPRFNFDSWYDPTDPWRRADNGSINAVSINGANQGIPSDHLMKGSVSDGAMTRLRYALSRDPAVIILNCGTNSIATGDVVGSNTPADSAYVIAQLDRMLTRIRQQGVWTVLSTLYPRADWPQGDARHQTTREVNAWIRAQSMREGVAGIIDPAPALTSATNPDGIDQTLYMDAVHLNAKGVNLVAKDYLLPLLRTLIAPGNVFDENAASNNLWPSSTYGLTGTAGTRTGAATTGSVATGYNLYMSRSGGGSTQVGSKDSSNATFNRQIITISPGATGAWDQSRLTFPVLATGLPQAGQWVRAYVRIEAADARSAVPVLTVSLLDGGGATIVQAQAGVIDSNQYGSAQYGANPPSGRGVFWLATKPFQVPQGAMVAQVTTTLVMNFWTGGYTPGSSFTVAVDRPILRLSADPRPAWNLP